MRGRGGGIEPLSETDIARRLRDLEEDGARWHTDSGGMFSLSGAQPKIALRLEGTEHGDSPGVTYPRPTF